MHEHDRLRVTLWRLADEILIEIKTELNPKRTIILNQVVTETWDIQNEA